jgi:hypothetical protein
MSPSCSRAYRNVGNATHPSFSDDDAWSMCEPNLECVTLIDFDNDGYVCGQSFSLRASARGWS